MLFPDHLVVVRGGGDLGTGAVYRLHKAGLPVVVLELAAPLAIRRAVAVSSAVDDDEVEVEGMVAIRVDDSADARSLAGNGTVAVMASPDLPDGLGPISALVDARLAKRNLDTSIDQADVVVGLGPGFTAGVDCHAVVETNRGPHLGRVLWDGSAEPNTGVPGVMGGESARRVVRAPVGGTVTWSGGIGDSAAAGEVIGQVADEPITAGVDGVIRGLIAEGRRVEAGTKVADIDPRGNPAACFEISDKALAVGGGVLEAVLTRLDAAP
ncbi:MAG: selenium-dependent molybdenum cofactor biosynthesis protein YqeB [Acidimicrobiia bacterium]